MIFDLFLLYLPTKERNLKKKPKLTKAIENKMGCKVTVFLAKIEKV